MSNYQAPLRDMRFVIHELVGSAPICALPAYTDCDAGLIDAVLASTPIDMHVAVREMRENREIDVDEAAEAGS